MCVRGYPGGGGGVLDWEVEFPAGYHLPFKVEMERHSREVWELLERVEMWAAYGQGGLDWEFCVDDLEVGFKAVGEGSDGLLEQEGA